MRPPRALEVIAGGGGGVPVVGGGGSIKIYGPRVGARVKTSRGQTLLQFAVFWCRDDF